MFSPSSLIVASISFLTFSTTSSILPGCILPSSMSRSSDSLAISLRNLSNPEIITASGVSSIIISTPVAISSARMLRPSLPMILPFISSDGRFTTLTVVSTVWSTAHFCMARPTILRASLSALSLVSSCIFLMVSAASPRASSSIFFIRSDLACSLLIPEISCRRVFSSCSILSRSSSRFFRSSYLCLSCCSLFLRSFSFCSMNSTFLSRFSSFCSRRFSIAEISCLRPFDSSSNSARILSKRSLASSADSLLRLSASTFELLIMVLALSSARLTFILAVYFLRTYPRMKKKTPPRKAKPRLAGEMFALIYILPLCEDVSRTAKGSLCAAGFSLL